jgi:hypothetical protein
MYHVNIMGIFSGEIIHVQRSATVSTLHIPSLQGLPKMAILLIIFRVWVKPNWLLIQTYSSKSKFIIARKQIVQ